MKKQRYILTDYYTGKPVMTAIFDTIEDAQEARRAYLKEKVESKEIHNNIIFIEPYER